MKGMERADTTVNLPPLACPHCGKVLEGTTGDCEPRGGDVSICVYCLGYLIFESATTLRAATAEEAAEMDGNPMVQEMKWLVTRARTIMRHKKN